MTSIVHRVIAVMMIAWLGVVSTPATAASPATNYQGLWWNPQESGWGINFAHQGDIIFATWFTYDTQGKPWWLIAVLDKSAEGIYSGSGLDGERAAVRRRAVRACAGRNGSRHHDRDVRRRD